MKVSYRRPGRNSVIHRIYVDLRHEVFDNLPGWLNLETDGELPVVHSDVYPHQIKLVHPSKTKAVEELVETDHFLRYWWDLEKKRYQISLTELEVKFFEGGPCYAFIDEDQETVIIRRSELEKGGQLKRYFDIDLKNYVGEFETELYFLDESNGTWTRLPNYLIRCGAR
jgi:hypothetical protein